MYLKMVYRNKNTTRKPIVRWYKYVKDNEQMKKYVFSIYISGSYVINNLPITKIAIYFVYKFETKEKMEFALQIKKLKILDW